MRSEEFCSRLSTYFKGHWDLLARRVRAREISGASGDTRKYPRRVFQPSQYAFLYKYSNRRQLEVLWHISGFGISTLVWMLSR
jgi:hypothetical protein